MSDGTGRNKKNPRIFAKLSQNLVKSEALERIRLLKHMHLVDVRDAGMYDKLEGFASSIRWRLNNREVTQLRVLGVIQSYQKEKHEVFPPSYVQQFSLVFAISISQPMRIWGATILDTVVFTIFSNLSKTHCNKGTILTAATGGFDRWICPHFFNAML